MEGARLDADVCDKACTVYGHMNIIILHADARTLTGANGTLSRIAWLRLVCRRTAKSIFLVRYQKDILVTSTVIATKVSRPKSDMIRKCYHRIGF